MISRPAAHAVSKQRVTSPGATAAVTSIAFVLRSKAILGVIVTEVNPRATPLLTIEAQTASIPPGEKLMIENESAGVFSRGLGQRVDAGAVASPMSDASTEMMTNRNTNSPHPPGRKDAVQHI